jgi:cysteinyl-tRNA synthetase
MLVSKAHRHIFAQATYPALHVYNSLSKQKEPLAIPIDRPLTWYQCGPTVYDHSHLGHALYAAILPGCVLAFTRWYTYSCYIRFDLIRRCLEQLGVPLLQAQGITDIDDKIISRATAENRPWLVLP